MRLHVDHRAQPLGGHKSEREILEILGRRHHHGIAQAVDFDGDRNFLGKLALDGGARAARLDTIEGQVHWASNSRHRKGVEDGEGEDGTVYYPGPTGGWGSVSGMMKVARAEHTSPKTLATLAKQNKPGGFMCVSCAWTKPAKPHLFEFCENGAKATFWEQTPRRCTPDFFAAHTLAELRGWRDYDLEQAGRLTHPMRYDAASDKYVPCGWDEAFAAIGKELAAIDPKSAVFYTSGRASLETSYAWALFARLYGHNNLPDSSNMCHETTSVALKKVIGAPVGTCILDDFDHCDAIFFFGQNTGSNSPRFLHTLAAASKRGCRIVTFNPIRGKGRARLPQPAEPGDGDGGRDQNLVALLPGQGRRRHRRDPRPLQACDRSRRDRSRFHRRAYPWVRAIRSQGPRHGMG